MDRYDSQLSTRLNLLTHYHHSNPGVRLGGAEVINPDEELARAVQLAKEADAVIAIVGLNADWETEGYDRTTLALPGRTDELIAKVAAANPKTIVVTQSVCDFHLLVGTGSDAVAVGLLDHSALGGFCRRPRPFMVSR